MIRVAVRMMPFASFPSRSLSDVRFLRFLVALDVGSQICLCGMKVFDDQDNVPHGTGAWYEWAVPVLAVIKPME
jgi:hypothetical protein